MRKLINYTKTEIKQIISNNLDIDIKNVKDNSYLSDLGIDSIDAVELILQLEKKNIKYQYLMS